VRATSLAAFAHQNLPFERLVEEIQPQRDMSRNPVFQVVFSFQNAAAQSLELPGLELSSLKVESRTSLFDLMLELRNSERGIVGSFEYNTDLFETSTIRMMIDHLRTLLAEVAANPPLVKEPAITQKPGGASYITKDKAEQFNFDLLPTL
jgi:non-ribosomal peptide synthetase component F